MKKLIYNETIILFLSVNDMITLKRNDLKKIKSDLLTVYDNCIIYNYFELKNNKNLIRDKINKLKFINQKRVYARNCLIRKINNVEKNVFLKSNHIQGSDKSQICYGAFYNDILVSVLCFDTTKKMNGGLKNNSYDLSRFSVKNGLVIAGIFNKLLRKFIFDYKPNKVISFADLNYTNKDRNIYIGNGFKLVKHIPPDFKIYKSDKDKLYHKFTYGTKFFKNNQFTPKEKHEIEKTLFRVWNCGKLKYELYLSSSNEIIFGFIYQIKNKTNGKIYIGQTTRNLNKRIYEYKKALNSNSFYNEHLLSSFKRYGWDNFEFTVIDTAQTIEELNQKEIDYISKYDSTNKIKGYNIELGGNNSIPTTETIEKMSKSHLGIKQTDEWINKRIATAGTEEAKKYGKKKSDEEKNVLSKNSPKYWLGKKRSEETKKKISETKRKNGPSEKLLKSNYKKVYQKDPNTLEIMNEFISTTEASSYIGVNQSTMSRWCSKNKVMKNYLWTYNFNNN